MNIGSRVEITSDPEIVAGNAEGVVAGFGHFITTGDYNLDDVWQKPVMVECVLVRLDHGFYSPGNEFFIDVLTVHRDNVRELVTA